MTTPYSKSIRYEYKLTYKLRKAGFLVIRAPSSGRNVYADIIAIKKRIILLFDVKYISKLETLYIKKKYFDLLKKVEEIVDGYGFYAVYVGELKEWRFIPLNQVEVISESYVKITPDKILNGLKLEDIVQQYSKI